MADIVGASRTTVLPIGATLRLTWVSPPLGLSSLFPYYFKDIVNKVPAYARIQPLSAPGVSSGDDSATMDWVNHSERAASDIADSVASLDGNFVKLQKLEVLTGAAKAAATARTEQAAQDRDKVSTDASNAAASAGVFENIKNQFLALGKGIQLVALAIIVLGVVYLYRSSRK